MAFIPALTSYVIDWGWLRIGPPYIYINIDPAIVRIGPFVLSWYGLMYAVAIILGLRIVRGYTTRKGITQAAVYRIVWWCIVAGIIGGRLYFVIQQPDLFSYYLAQPQHILATWEGGMAFYGAIFLVIPTLIWLARRERINPLVLLDAGVLFAAAGQIFGRIGNLINGDIIGYRSTLPWSTVYQNPHSWACLNPATCNVPVQPAAGYELLTNILMLGLMFFIAWRVRRPGILMLVYLFGYAITQFLLFFVRDNLIVSFLGLNWGLKQAQWTSLVVLVILLPVTYLVLRYSKPIPAGEVAATYGIPQKPAVEDDRENVEKVEKAGEKRGVEEGKIEGSESESVKETTAEGHGDEGDAANASREDEVAPGKVREDGAAPDSQEIIAENR
ncbi:MAG: prolipoprotein diacylglyceryl transferase [Ktedonobacter sp. 13_1_20CM_3_54_15]|jgi:phosphatidylglycerol:prolipoprotein diacylglycerol transferase|nr:MAG: prolipoprotein diacylglyceryl transferase [Ktedonobacter sp. 13_2_20CM_53_11]OLB57450.1 MAG: prolipoprotein diacylglyceryl transferase [Ktedonobacter sp. 13_2_20CM_2_56_8]OLE07002.1 MAG: prolipoprotein diacylglyceryl transferase [Ktedonobacter sp. 13_1_20CM_4_53_11]OLE34216.1 MAG: prolipoprotein diacylglyceryl transferase [Ktedonobacter sp. 13_1_20CM_3_54_15]